MAITISRASANRVKFDYGSNTRFLNSNLEVGSNSNGAYIIDQNKSYIYIDQGEVSNSDIPSGSEAIADWLSTNFFYQNDKYVGESFWYWNSVAPNSSCLLEDGGSISRTTYEVLFNTIKTELTDGSTTSSSAIVTFSDTSDLYGGMKVEGSGIPSGTTIDSVDSGTQITLSTNSTATGTDVVLTFIPPAFGFGDGSTTFNKPDSRSRMIIAAGQGSGLLNRELGSSGGSEEPNSIPVSDSTASEFTPSPAVALAKVTSGMVSISAYSNNTPNTTILGDSQEGNLPPYLSQYRFIVAL